MEGHIDLDRFIICVINRHTLGKKQQILKIAIQYSSIIDPVFCNNWKDHCAAARKVISDNRDVKEYSIPTPWSATHTTITHLTTTEKIRFDLIINLYENVINSGILAFRGIFVSDKVRNQMIQACHEGSYTIEFVDSNDFLDGDSLEGINYVKEFFSGFFNTFNRS